MDNLNNQLLIHCFLMAFFSKLKMAVLNNQNATLMPNKPNETCKPSHHEDNSKDINKYKQIADNNIQYLENDHCELV